MRAMLPAHWRAKAQMIALNSPSLTGRGGDSSQVMPRKRLHSQYAALYGGLSDSQVKNASTACLPFRPFRPGRTPLPLNR